MVGGNGGNAAANAIHKECEKQGIMCGVVGVPKSIDNDILLVRGAAHGLFKADGLNPVLQCGSLTNVVW